MSDERFRVFSNFVMDSQAKPNEPGQLIVVGAPDYTAEDIATLLNNAEVENEDSVELSKFRDKYDALELEIEQSTKQTDRLLSDSIAKYRREGLSRLDITLRLINVLRIVVAQYGQS